MRFGGGAVSQVQPPKPFRLRYPVIVGILGLVMLVGGGVYIGILTQFQNPAACVSTPCFAAAVIALAGFVMVHRSVTGTLDGLARAGYLPGKRSKSIPQIWVRSGGRESLDDCERASRAV